MEEKDNKRNKYVFCKFNSETLRFYFLPSIWKIQKECSKNGLILEDLIALDNITGVLFLTSNSKFAKTFNSKFFAEVYRFFACISPSLKLIKLSELE